MPTDENLLNLDKKSLKKLHKLTEQSHPDAARAKALIALAEGMTNAAAAEHAGLTLPQLRYWVGRFRSKQFDCFTSLNEASAEAKPDKKAKKDKKDKIEKKVKKADKKSKKSDKKKGSKANKPTKKKTKK